MKHEVIEFLTRKKQEIEDQQRCVSAVISMIEDGKYLQQLPEASIGIEDKKNVRKAYGKLRPTNSYESASKLDEKIAYGLTVLEKCDKEELLKLILDVDKNLNPYKFEKALAVRLSFLLKTEQIIGQKSGRKYSYALH